MANDETVGNLKTITGWLSIAAIAWGNCSLTVCHAHDGLAQEPSTHQPAHSPSGGHSHGHGESHHHHHDSRHDDVEPTVSHLHVYVLGMNFTLPARHSHSHDSGDRESPCDDFYVVAGIGGPGVKQARVLASVPIDDAVAIALDVPGASMGAVSGPLLTSPRLCDRARHERTGVLLS